MNFTPTSAQLPSIGPGTIDGSCVRSSAIRDPEEAQLVLAVPSGPRNQEEAGMVSLNDGGREAVVGEAGKGYPHGSGRTAIGHRGV